MKQYNVSGMSCAACSARVEKAVAAVSGVEQVSVNLLTNSMLVKGVADDAAIISAVEAAGYGASPKEESAKANSQATAPKEKTEHKLKMRLIASIGFLLVLMYLSMGHMMFGWWLPDVLATNPVAVALCQMLLAGIVMVINQRFFINGAKGFFHGSPNMDTLVSIGSAASFGYSLWVTFAMSGAVASGDMTAATSYLHDLYYESAAMILTLITVGKMLEARAKGKTTNALAGLMALAPQTATVVREGQEVHVPIADVRKGDVFLVRPAEQVPVDGIVLSGHSAVNESALTGESIPVEKTEHSSVQAGTMNVSGVLRCEATRVGEDTTLAQIIRMVSDASATKAPIAKIADRVSGVFVPVVIGIAIVTLCIWLLAGETFGFAIARAISVLVISCPCALGLATPVAIMVGTGMGAKHGILYKTAEALELAGRTQIVALDKTGTVTMGDPAVTGIYPTAGVGATELLTLAAALEKNSEHPLAKAIMKQADAEKIVVPTIADLTILPGSGLRATHKGETLLGGNQALIATVTTIPEAMCVQAEALAQQGHTALYFALGERLLGMITAADIIRPESREAIAQLHKMGIRVVMLTGDNKLTAESIGKEAGVDTVIAEVLPAEKEATIRNLQQEGKVTMIGDGINDAPALTTADVGIAIGAGTDIAIDAADVVLVNSRLTDAATAIRLSRKTLRIIRQNLFWAFIYNVVGIPLAAGLWYPIFGWELNPMFGAAAMSLSSFCVVSNALRLYAVRIAEKQSSDAIAIEKVEVKTVQKTMHIEGMMCGHCEARVKKTLEGIAGVTEATVSHTAGTAVIALSTDVSNDTLKAAVEAQDYTVTAIE